MQEGAVAAVRLRAATWTRKSLLASTKSRRLASTSENVGNTLHMPPSSRGKIIILCSCHSGFQQTHSPCVRTIHLLSRSCPRHCLTRSAATPLTTKRTPQHGRSVARTRGTRKNRATSNRGRVQHHKDLNLKDVPNPSRDEMDSMRAMTSLHHHLLLSQSRNPRKKTSPSQS